MQPLVALFLFYILTFEPLMDVSIAVPNSTCTLVMRRDDLLHPQISGNKFRKLKYNLLEAKDKGFKTILTFGGAFSNHIAATAAAGEIHGLKTIGFIRGEELAANYLDNPTLALAASLGMEFVFIDRETYKNKHNPAFLVALQKEYPQAYIVPEGGSNHLAIKGCEEILDQEGDVNFDYVATPVGTGGTLSGIIRALKNSQKAIGFTVVRDSNLESFIQSNVTSNASWCLNADYDFGGYAKYDDQLIAFINWFKSTYQIPLDPIYTGKMMFGIFDMISKGAFPQGAKILVIHTGGLQGIAGINQKLSKKNQKLII